MKKIILRSELLKPALKKLQHAIPKNDAVPALQNLFCEVQGTKLQMVSSDTEVTIFETLEVESTGDFNMLIPFADFQKIISSYDSSIPVELQNISTKRSRLVISKDIHEISSACKPEDFPKLPATPSKSSFKLNKDFISLLSRAMHTCGKDDNAPALAKACLDISPNQVIIVSTDAHSLFKYALAAECDETESLLVSPKIAKVIEGFSETELSFHAKNIAFVSGNTKVIATRHEYKYPNYNAVIKMHPANLTIERAELIRSVERASISNESQLDLHFEKSLLKLIADDRELHKRSQIEIACQYSGSVEKLSLNPRRLHTLLSQIDYEVISLHVLGPDKGVLISSEADSNYLGMIVPIH